MAHAVTRADEPKEQRYSLSILLFEKEGGNQIRTVLVVVRVSCREGLEIGVGDPF